MKAPDKIYLLRNKIGVILSSWFLVSDSLLENIEYIRKDALLEWAKENSAELLEAARCQQEQPEVDFKPLDEDFERDAVSFCFDSDLNTTPHIAKTIAKHFYELGLNARKEDEK